MSDLRVVFGVRRLLITMFRMRYALGSSSFVCSYFVFHSALARSLLSSLTLCLSFCICFCSRVVQIRSYISL
jgi:hypothetical protein